MKLIICIIALIFCIGWSVWMIANPDSYRNFLADHPGMDAKGTWSDASDAKIRIAGVVVILISMACIFFLLTVLGVI